MDRYKVVKPIAEGSFGTVCKGLNRITGEPVAIKTMRNRYFSWEECLSLREIKSLRKLTHPNLVKLKEVIRVNDELHLVFEYMEMNLFQLMKNRTRAFPEPQIRAILYQVLQGLAFLHKHGYFHRDIKPENLLLTEGICKIADFGQAREIRSKPLFTDYVSTRWYRAPEVLLKSSIYNSPVDLFAVGCIMAELYNLKPFAPGSNENDQMFKLCSILGAPSLEQWPEGFKLASQCGYYFPGLSAQSFSVLVPGSCFEGVQIMIELFQWNPQRRVTPAQSRDMPIFRTISNITILPLQTWTVPSVSGLQQESQILS
jgi:serine/threonine protein kinase